MKIYLFLFFVFYLSCISYSQDWKFSAQVQLRSELDGRDFSDNTHALTFASLRTRAGVEKTFMDKVRLFVQVQDSRVFGEEPNTLSHIDNVDLHQGYVELIEPLDIPATIQAGRFEVVYGTERFFGAVGWHYIGRAWDGVRLSFNTGFDFDIFALTHTESNEYISNAVPANYPFPSVSEPSQSVYGAWTTFTPGTNNRLDFFGFYNKRRNIAFDPENDIFRVTLGGNYAGTFDNFSTIAEAAYQAGKNNDTDIAAYLLSLQLFLQSGSAKFGAGADILSGTEPGSDKINTFTVDFGTNHKFYGYMDYFINIPNNTFDLGLHDFYLSALIKPQDSQWSGSAMFHHFTSNKETPDGETVFGQELDLTIGYQFVPGTTVSWGGSLFFPGDLMKLMFATEAGQREDMAFWSYIMITASL